MPTSLFNTGKVVVAEGDFQGRDQKAQEGCVEAVKTGRSSAWSKRKLKGQQQKTQEDARVVFGGGGLKRFGSGASVWVAWWTN